MRTAFAGVVVVLLVITFGSTAFSQTAIGFNGIGGELGLVIPEGDIGNTVGLGVVSDLGTITEVIHPSASIDYWSKSYDVGDLWDSSFRQILIGGISSYYFPVSSVFKPYGGAGLNITLSKGEADYKGPDDLNTGLHDSSVSSTDIGIHLVGGVEKKLTPDLKGFAELKYHTGGSDYFAIFAGAVFLLGR